MSGSNKEYIFALRLKLFDIRAGESPVAVISLAGKLLMSKKGLWIFHNPFFMRTGNCIFLFIEFLHLLFFVVELALSFAVLFY
jgi:hypothetical protein